MRIHRIRKRHYPLQNQRKDLELQMRQPTYDLTAKITSHAALLLVILWGVCVGTCAKAQDIKLEGKLFAELTERGLPFSANDLIRLPLPTLLPSLTEAARAEALQKLAGKHEWSRFSRDSVMAPITIEIETVNSSQGERLGMTVHNAFIAHASMERLRDKEAMEQIFGRPNDAAESNSVVTAELTPEELRKLGFTEQADSAATYAYLELPLLNQIIVRGVVCIEKRERAGAVEFFWRLDPAFNSVEKYASRWTKLERNSVGKLLEGESFPYTGCGGFMGVYELDPAIKQLLVESRLLLREPKEWFSGSNFLRSKLPPMMQENARNFRRKMASL